jgi:phosphoglycolate phosphatase
LMQDRSPLGRRNLLATHGRTIHNGIHGSVPGGGLDRKPELLAHILSQHNVLPSHGLMVGDRRYDISGAHAVGMRGLGVLWGYGTRDELETAGADQLVESSADLARTVLSMVSGKQSTS